MSPFNELFIFFAALVAGFINAMAGGGTLVSFPALLAIGIPPIAANVTNTIALVPEILRWIVVSAGLIAATVFFLKNQMLAK